MSILCFGTMDGFSGSCTPSFASTAPQTKLVNGYPRRSGAKSKLESWRAENLCFSPYKDQQSVSLGLQSTQQLLQIIIPVRKLRSISLINAN